MATNNDVYTLHYFPFSLYSLMVRFALVIGRRLNPDTAPNVEIKLVNLHREENFSEQYLTLVNSKGQVPALTSAAFSSPLAESYDISKWLCEKQPDLIPEEHREAIESLMDKLYSFHAKTLTIGSDQKKHGIPNRAAELLEQKDLSESHRRALEIKSVFHDLRHNTVFTPSGIKDVEDKARIFIQELDKTLDEESQGQRWIFGKRPTILDAHATVMIARLMEVKRQDLLTERVQEYTRRVLASEEWNEVTHGRATRWNASMGDVADMNPL
ncbi:hypothetical protein M441DRAFT_64980 [Trichoderma asperellum CBS 433.97]|uniref:GST N-terminal domain-containing protein n=1 Tax=Trichoderma asperellum (strain ATCC 204424 / CBS 433.97 / NBRC 101777) TaxID=1042311 RepID=A0A2T3ZKI1_TRIA4|nr:hypothetical protein M441DRAFT_64980 [Trichoderma asperellum CBS 433.97]PTB45317.1 hypothetical protein M441DRAFT_64980 [Trichoderma asperellum CBS 433.97]